MTRNPSDLRILPYEDESIDHRRAEMQRIREAVKPGERKIISQRDLVAMYARLSWEIDKCDEALATEPTGLSPPLPAEVGVMIDPLQDELLELRRDARMRKSDRADRTRDYVRYGGLACVGTQLVSGVAGLPVLSLASYIAYGLASAAVIVNYKWKDRQDAKALQLKTELKERQRTREDVEQSRVATRELIREVSLLFGEICCVQDGSDRSAGGEFDARRRAELGSVPSPDEQLSRAENDSLLAAYGELAIILRSVHDPEIADEQMWGVTAKLRGLELIYETITNSKLPRGETSPLLSPSASDQTRAVGNGSLS